MARKTVLDAVRIAARRLFRAPALNRTLSSAGEAFFQLDSVLSPVPDRVSLSPAVQPFTGKEQAGKEAISFDARQQAMESAVRRETPLSAAGMEERAAFLRKAPGLTETRGDRTTTEAATAVWAKEQTARQRTGTELWRSAVQTAADHLGEPAMQTVKSILQWDEARAETANLPEAMRSAAVLPIGTQTPTARESNHTPIAWTANAENGGTFQEMGAIVSTIVPRSVENIIFETRGTAEEVMHTAAAPTPQQEQNAAVSAWNQNSAVSSAQSDFGDISTMGADNAAIRQTEGTVAAEMAAVWQALGAGTAENTAAGQTVRIGKVGIMQAEGRAERSSAFSTGTLSLVENTPAFSFPRTAQQETAGSGRIRFPLLQPAGEESLSSLPRPVRENASVSTTAEQTARSSPAVRQKEAAPTSEGFWDQWARRFAGELHSSPEGVHG